MPMRRKERSHLTLTCGHALNLSTLVHTQTCTHILPHDTYVHTHTHKHPCMPAHGEDEAPYLADSLAGRKVSSCLQVRAEGGL